MFVNLQIEVALDPNTHEETHEDWDSGDIIYF